MNVHLAAELDDSLTHSAQADADRSETGELSFWRDAFAAISRASGER
jgi:hypothetical protein